MAESARGGFLRRATRSILSRYPTRLIGEVFDTGLGPLKDMEKEMQELTDRFSRMLSRWPSRSSGTREALTVADWSP